MANEPRDDDLIRVTPMSVHLARVAAHERLVESGVFPPPAQTPDQAPAYHPPTPRMTEAELNEFRELHLQLGTGITAG
jgi:hypothetical protein